MKSIYHQSISFRLLCWLVIAPATVFLLIYLTLLAIIWLHAQHLSRNPQNQVADAILILGNRAHLGGKPNPCLTGRIDKGLQLASQDMAATLVMTGGRDHDGRIQAEVMKDYARSKGFGGKILIEPYSSSTKENLEYSAPILKTAGIKSVIIVSEPYHLWRAEKLVAAGHLKYDFNVSYAAAPTECWTSRGMLFRGALREPLAIMRNYTKGYFSRN